nr:Glucans biosynthesis protein C [Candidatus Pantoea persica]
MEAPPALKQLFVRFNPVMCFGAIGVFIAYSLNQRYSSGDGWLYEIDALITTLMGLCMLNVCFCVGHRLLNAYSPRIMYLVNTRCLSIWSTIRCPCSTASLLRR